MSGPAAVINPTRQRCCPASFGDRSGACHCPMWMLVRRSPPTPRCSPPATFDSFVAEHREVFAPV
ncbi:hypothetical protein FNH05_06520 [Amycolatopsis rhizosphaerae]|uniref:Uncharacterized protein n=1 Tax=Amycolatopsis rhizosphaerae TaxID=2053003 RepID=A0A558DBQ1_9PSEU|nr:hypothetical protein [Amycolatopsis rhizosphaerae]TVT58457.1 hypothetical protein FNH05_06520 [Amycolatopsis rhizosphaerae]